MSEFVKVDVEHGYYLFKLGKIMHDKNISINKLATDTNIDFKVVKRIMTGELVRMDIFVLDRLCNYLECSLNDLIEYIAS